MVHGDYDGDYVNIIDGDSNVMSSLGIPCGVNDGVYTIMTITFDQHNSCYYYYYKSLIVFLQLSVGH